MRADSRGATPTASSSPTTMTTTTSMMMKAGETGAEEEAEIVNRTLPPNTQRTEEGRVVAEEVPRTKMTTRLVIWAILTESLCHKQAPTRCPRRTTSEPVTKTETARPSTPTMELHIVLTTERLMEAVRSAAPHMAVLAMQLRSLLSAIEKRIRGEEIRAHLWRMSVSTPTRTTPPQSTAQG